MKKIFVLVVCIFLGLCSYAIEADDSVDEIIKKTFNAESSDLPKLPKISPKSIESQNFLDLKKNTNPPVEQINSKQNVPKDITNVPKIPQKINVRTAKIGWGKKFNVKFDTNVSDRAGKGSSVSFTTQAPVVTKQITLPAGTKIFGTVTNSHSPQIFGNGGLLSIKIDYISSNGKTSYCEGNIVELNHKKVLFNNIKGDNGYASGVKKVLKPAQTFYSKSLSTSKKLWNSPGFILAPITYVPGAFFLVGDAVVSPFIAVFHKGKKVYIPKGTNATIKLTSPAYIEY